MARLRGSGGSLPYGSSMEEADFYDRILSDHKQPASQPLDDSPWLPIYEAAAKLVNVGDPICDLGCGPGLFAQLLNTRGHLGGYWGIDFSKVAIRKARRIRLSCCYANFTQADLRYWKPPDDLIDGVVFTCTEVLEHLDGDIELIAGLPPGHRLIATVPNYGSEAHVRKFLGPGQIWERYSPYLLFTSWRLIDLDVNGRAIHLFEATTRNESWR